MITYYVRMTQLMARCDMPAPLVMPGTSPLIQVTQNRAGKATFVYCATGLPVPRYAWNGHVMTYAQDLEPDWLMIHADTISERLP